MAEAQSTGALLPASAGNAAEPASDEVGKAVPHGPALSRPLHESIAQFVLDTRYEDLPPKVVEKARAQIVHSLGLAFTGYYNYENDIARAVLSPLAQGGPHSATMIGERIRLSPSDAAFANATMMRALFLDDVMFPGAVHPEIITLPAGLAVGEITRASGRELLVALVLGYEVLGKLGAAAYGWGAPQPRRPTMIYGGYGPVTVAGRLLRLDPKQMANAYGYAANLCMGVPGDGQMDHFYGFFSFNGVLAAQIARAGGVPFSPRTLEGDLGLYRSFFGKVPAELPKLVASLGSDWEIFKTEFKPHHGTAQNSVAIELLLDLVRTHRLTADQVARIRVAVAQERAGRKENFNKGPFTARDAYSSLPYALARALLDGRVAADQYGEAEIGKPLVNATVQKIEILFEKRPSRYYRIEVLTHAGKTHTGMLDRHDFPFPRSAWRPWLQKDGGRLLGDKALLEIERQILSLEDVPDISQLTTLLAPGSLRPSA